MSWDDIATPGAFCIGVVLGAFASFRVTQLAIDYLREELRTHRRDEL